MEKPAAPKQPVDHRPTPVTPPPGKNGYQSLLNNVLLAALEGTAFHKRVSKILDLLLADKRFNFGKKAALLIVEQNSDTLTVKVSKGFSGKDKLPCSQTRFGLCHCGEVAKSGHIQFFTTTPALHEITKNPKPFPGNYCIPIVKDQIPLGVFSIYTTKDHKPTTEITTLLEGVANIFAVMIESKAMDQQLIQLVNELRASIINLREEKKFSESIIQGLNHGLIVADLDGKIRKSNGAAQQILQSFTDNLDGQNLKELLGPALAKKLLSAPTPNAEHFNRELSLVTPEGERKVIGFSNVSREDASSKTVGVIVSLSDISELKYTRKEMEKMNRLSTVAEIASAVAHEVRNPLAGIKIMAQSIEEEAGSNSEQLECSQRIIRQVDRLNVLLSDFFSYARPVEPDKRPTSLPAIIYETEPLIQNRLSKNNIKLFEDIGSGLPKIIADTHQVQQVFLNLFLNAIDAIREGGRIDITARKLSQTGLASLQKSHPTLLHSPPYVMVTFTDNGAGMTQKVADQAFEPFFTTKTSGAGLGLSIVYRTLKENDAAILLKSTEGKGTTFTIFFRAEN